MENLPPALKTLLTQLWPFAETNGLQAAPIAGDASDRRFWRFRCGLSTAVGVSGQDSAENMAYFMIGRHLLKTGLPLPEIFIANPEAGVFIMEDLGSENLQDLALSPRGPELYLETARVLARFHELGRLGFDVGWCHQTPYYDRQLVLDKEINYFLNHLAFGWAQLDPGPARREALAQEAKRLAVSILPQPEELVLIHRDYQSRNVMIKNNAPRLIDWQGARLGPAGYDLVSLIYDPYVPGARSMKSALVAAYLAARTTLGPSRARDALNQDRLTLLGVARLMQALGAYGRLSAGKPAFAAYIPQALNDLARLWRHPALAGLKAFGRLIEQCVEAASGQS